MTDHEGLASAEESSPEGLGIHAPWDPAWRSPMQIPQVNWGEQGPPQTPSQESTSSVLDRLFGGKSAEQWLADLEAEHRAHAATCREALCDSCERYACASCRRVRVDENGRWCRRCSVDAGMRERIPRRYASADLSDNGMMGDRVRSRKAVAVARRSTEAAAVVLHGPSGTGKTTLAAAMLRARLEVEHARGERRSVLWGSAIDLGRARSEHRLGDGEAELLAEAESVDLLVIDDVGAEAARDSDVIGQIIHRRHDDERATWVTTGFAAADIAARYGGGVERRLYEGAALIDCGGPR